MRMRMRMRMRIRTELLLAIRGPMAPSLALCATMRAFWALRLVRAAGSRIEVGACLLQRLVLLVLALVNRRNFRVDVLYKFSVSSGLILNSCATWSANNWL